MAPPYARGDHVAWLNTDHDGVRVRRVEVLEVTAERDGWSVRTTEGHEWVDRRGEGSRLVPIDDELQRDFEVRGESFIVESTVQQIESQLDPNLDWRQFDHDLEREREDLYRDRDQ